MPDDTYVLDLMVTGADEVMVNDDGIGVDTISVQGIYTSIVEISLCCLAVGGQTTRATGQYFDANDKGHRLYINGLIENVIGSNGQDLIAGNEAANRLWGEADLQGPGAADTISGGAGNDTVHGGVGADELFGDGDDDLICGDAGNDTIAGGAGRDTVEGGAGADSLIGGGATGDMLIYRFSPAGVTLSLVVGAFVSGSGGDAEGDSISGFTDIVGTLYRDVLTDGDKSTLPNHANDNAFYGGGGSDRLVLGGGDDLGLGGNGNDMIQGQLGNDVLIGGNGNDVLLGGRGADTMTGGVGADQFEFQLADDSSPSPAAQDVITDFSSAQMDRIDLSKIDALVRLTGNQAFVLIAGAFTGAGAEVRLQALGADLLVLCDVNGDLQADFSLQLTGVAMLTSDDFIL